MIECYVTEDTMVRWPSGLRRQTKAFISNLVLTGVGSNPTLIKRFGLFLSAKYWRDKDI